MRHIHFRWVFDQTCRSPIGLFVGNDNNNIFVYSLFGKKVFFITFKYFLGEDRLDEQDQCVEA